MVYLIITFLLIYGFLAWRQLGWALMLVLFLLPSYQIRFSVFGVPSTLLEAMILVAFFVWLLSERKKIVDNIKKAFSKKEKIERKVSYPFNKEIILVLVVSYIAVGIALFSNSALGIWKAYFFEPILFFVLVLNVFRAKSEDKKIYFHFGKIIWPLAVSALLISGVAVLQRLGLVYSPANFWPRVTGPFPYPNALGLYLGPLVLLLVGYIVPLIFNFKFLIFKQFSISQFLKLIFLFVVITLSVVAIVLAGSEGAVAGVLIGAVVMAIFYFENKILKNIGKVAVSLILLFIILSPWFFLKVIPEHKYYNFSAQSLNYLSDKAMLKDFSGEVRKQQWRETWGMMTASPKIFIFGTGLSNYQMEVKPYHQEGIFFNHERDTDFRRKIVWFDAKYKAEHWRPVEIYMYPHNIFLNFWTELGLLGVLAFLWLVGKFLYFSIKYQTTGIKENKYIVLGLLGAMIVIIVHGIVDVPYFKNDLAVIFWVLLAILGMVKLENKELKKN